MSENIRVKLPDGTVKEVPKGTTPFAIAQSISPRLASAALAAQLLPYDSLHVGCCAGEHDMSDVVDLARPIEKDCDLRLLTEKDPESLGVY